MASVASASLNSAASTGSAVGAKPQLDMLAVLQAAPLMHDNRPVPLLDHKSERDTIVASARRAGRQVHVVCDFCTTRRMGALLTDGCRMLHYSGHGFSDVDGNGKPRTRLAFENEEGGTHALNVRAVARHTCEKRRARACAACARKTAGTAGPRSVGPQRESARARHASPTSAWGSEPPARPAAQVEKLTALVKAGADCSGGRPPLDLAFVSACHSVGGGQAFVNAGVPHVVAVREPRRAPRC
eukprot:2347429-Prymnesium_polylepis.1